MLAVAVTVRTVVFNVSCSCNVMLAVAVTVKTVVFNVSCSYNGKNDGV